MYCIVVKRFNDVEKVYGPYNDMEDAQRALKEAHCKNRDYSFLLQEIKAPDKLFDFMNKINKSKKR